MHCIFGLLYLFIVNWDIALMIVSSFIFLLVASMIYTGKNAENSKDRKVAFKVIIMGIQEMLNYITTIKTFSKEEDESFIYEQSVERAFKYQAKMDKYLCLY